MKLMDLNETSKRSAVGNPFVGKSPYSGETELTIMPEERKAVDALISAYRDFSELIKNSHPYAGTLLNEFTEGIHWAQLAVGTVRFYHTLNQEYRKHTHESSMEPMMMTSSDKLGELFQWKEDFKSKILLRNYSLQFQSISMAMLEALDQLLLLTKNYPDQHVYDDFIKGLVKCEDVLNRLHLESLVHS